jgi:[ribosomal protein S5]-alanine N-acetyltransferase
MIEKTNEFTSIKTKRLTIRPVCLDDKSSIYEIFSNDNLMDPYGMFPIDDIKKIDDFTRRLIEDQELAIILDECNKIIGTFGFIDYSKYNNRAEIAFELLEDYHKKAYMTEAITALLEYGFNELELNRVEAFVYPSNLASQKLLEKLGFEKEGLLKKRSFQRGQYRDMIAYGLLK